METKVEVRGHLLTAGEVAERLLGCKSGKSTIFRMAVKNLIPWVPWGPNLGSIRFEEDKVRVALAQLVEQRKANREAKREVRRKAKVVEA